MPGDPSSDPGPQPPLNVDVTRPVLSGAKLAKGQAQGGGGVPLTIRLSEKGRLEAQYYRLSAGNRRYAGFGTWKVNVGRNTVKLGARWKRFDAEPGHYEAVLRATDPSANKSKSAKLRFSIAGWASLRTIG